MSVAVRSAILAIILRCLLIVGVATFKLEIDEASEETALPVENTLPVEIVQPEKTTSAKETPSVEETTSVEEITSLEETTSSKKTSHPPPVIKSLDEPASIVETTSPKKNPPPLPEIKSSEETTLVEETSSPKRNPPPLPRIPSSEETASPEEITLSEGTTSAEETTPPPQVTSSEETSSPEETTLSEATTLLEETTSLPEETPSPSSYHLLCAGNPWNSPCAGEYSEINSEPKNATALAEVASSWNDRLLTELTMLSMESHASFCPDTDKVLEFVHVAIARTIVDLLTSPSTMQRVHEILANETLTAIEDCKLHGANFFRDWMSMVDNRIQKDSILSDEYNATRQVNLGKKFTPASTPFVIVGDDSRLCAYTVFREALVNRLFMNEAFNLSYFGQNTSHEIHKYTAFARNVVALALETDDDNQRSLVNQIYKAALLEVALEMRCKEHTESEMKAKLFEILTRHLVGDTGLRSAMESRMLLTLTRIDDRAARYYEAFNLGP